MTDTHTNSLVVRPEDVAVTRIMLGQGYRDTQLLGQPAAAEGVSMASITHERRATG